jgi:hypothetical protein
VRRRLLAAILVVLVPHLALPRPAVVRELGAVARSEPSRDAGAVQAFLEGDEVAVSDEVRDGWRRVRLEDGTAAWIEDGVLAFPEEAAASTDAAPIAPAATPPAEEPPPSETPAPHPDLRARVYVKDVPDLAARVSSDGTVSPRANALASRWRTSTSVWVVGGIASLALLGVSAVTDLPRSSDARFESSLDTKGKLVAGAVLVSFATGLIGLVIHPRHGEVREVVAAWNATHPDQQVELAFPGGAGGE